MASDRVDDIVERSRRKSVAFVSQCFARLPPISLVKKCFVNEHYSAIIVEKYSNHLPTCCREMSSSAFPSLSSRQLRAAHWHRKIVNGLRKNGKVRIFTGYNRKVSTFSCCTVSQISVLYMNIPWTHKRVQTVAKRITLDELVSIL